MSDQTPATVSESNPLTNLLSPKQRAVLYALLSLSFTVFSVVQAAGGDWKQAALGLFPILLGLLGASNASTTPTA